MAIDSFQDELIPLSHIARSLPNQPSPACLWRWHRRGVKGVRLETIVVGGRRYTTRAAWEEFVRRTTAEADRENADESTGRTKENRRKLTDAGLLCSDRRQRDSDGEDCQT
ncbi:MAG: DUF1580 domain-containing protein [Planctomycetes bacterium]|nr:DUF1580 domain-containing protein [Planctomycetota bacterium]